MTNPFKITPTPPTSIKLEPGQDGKFSFTVESLEAPEKVREVMVQALLVGEDGKGKEVDWLLPEPRRTLSMTGGKTETVTIAAKPTSTSPKGKHNIKIVIADKERPNDVFAESPAVACEVTGSAETKPPGPKIPWWLIAAIAGGVVVIAGVIVLIVVRPGGGKPRRADLGEACSKTAECDEGLLCATGKCLLAGGEVCTAEDASLCASGACVTKAKVCAIPLGEACELAAKDVVPCPNNSVCDPGKKKCLGMVGATCKADAECETAKCTGGVCAMSAPGVNAGDPCEGTCPAPLLCHAKHCVEQKGRPCTANNQCITGLCQGGVCDDPAPMRDCTKDGICGPEQSCRKVQPNISRCKWTPGHPCTGHSECTSNWCNNGSCSRDDGKCDSQNDCPSPYRCILAKKECLLAIGMICGGHAECDSSYCNNNRCAPSPCPTCPTRCIFATGKCSSKVVFDRFREFDKRILLPHP